MNSVGKITKKVIKAKPIYVVAMILLVIAVVLLSLIPPQILKVIIDDYLLAGVAEGLLAIGIIYLASYILIGVFDFLKAYLLTVAGQKIIKEIRIAMESKLTRLRASYFTKNSIGTLSSKFMNDVDNINTLFTDGVVSMIIDCFKIIGIVVSIWIFSFRLGIFAIAMIPIVAVITAYFKKRMLRAQVTNLAQVGNVNNHIVESIKNIIMIKTFNKEGYMENTYKKHLDENYKTMARVSFYDSSYSPIIQIMTAMAISFVFYFASGDNNILGISIGEIAAATNLITNLFTPIDTLGMELQSIQKGLSGIRSVDDFLATQEEEEGKVYLDLDEARRTGVKIKIEKLSFGYEERDGVAAQGLEKNSGKMQEFSAPKNSKLVIDGLDAEINPYENVAFVGRTGAGKTTLFKLIEGLLRPTAGRVLINGVDAYSIAAAQKRRIFGYVEQQFSFVSGDVMQQITLGDETISRADVEAALEFVGLKAYAEGFDHGLETEVREEMFSQGQKQLLAIARAIAADPLLLLLDEVTANLDSVTEEKVVQVLKGAGRGKTILSIAHRQSTIYSADRIIEIKYD